MVYLGKIMVLGSHPVNRDKILIRKLSLQLLTQFNSGSYFVDKVERAGKNIELVPRSNGVGVVLAK